MSLNPSSCASAIWAEMQVLIETDDSGVTTGNRNFGTTQQFASLFATKYHDYASAGVVPGATSGGGDKSILEAAFGINTTPSLLALAFASYWATVAIAPGAPAHGGISVSLVVNTAATLVSAFEAAIMATITQSESKPFYLSLIDNIETMAVSQIIWNVTEIMPGPPPFPMIYPEPIS